MKPDAWQTTAALGVLYVFAGLLQLAGGDLVVAAVCLAGAAISFGWAFVERKKQTETKNRLNNDD